MVNPGIYPPSIGDGGHLIITHGDIGHVAPISHKHMDPVVHVFDAVVTAATAVAVSDIGKGRLLVDQVRLALPIRIWISYSIAEGID
ncbi:MAG: hypothetical protein Q9194_001882 [Teloschistes cf. exilis]